MTAGVAVSRSRLEAVSHSLLAVHGSPRVGNRNSIAVHVLLFGKGVGVPLYPTRRVVVVEMIDFADGHGTVAVIAKQLRQRNRLRRSLAGDLACAPDALRTKAC